MQKALSTVAALALLLLSACDEDKATLNIPTAYDGSSFSANTATQAAVRSQLASLTSIAQAGRTPGQSVSLSDLQNAFDAGTPSLADISTSYYANRLSESGGFLEELAKASGGSYTPGTPTGEGGTFGGYLFDENGLELEQLVEKGLFGAAMYQHANELVANGVTLAEVDQMISIFGAHPDFPNTDNSATASNPDRFMARYAARRDKNDGQGLYTRTRDAFIKLQAAVKAGDDYAAEREEALDAIFDNWEKANAATIINYCHSTISKLSATNPSEGDVGSALHAYGEAVGFIHGWRTVSGSYRRISDAQIDAILVLLNAPYDGTPTSYKFATDPVSELPKLTQVINQLRDLYGFSAQDIEDFKKNWVSEQGR